MNPSTSLSVPDQWPEMTARVEARRKLVEQVTSAIRKGRTYHFRFLSDHPQDKHGVAGRVIRWSEGNDDTEPYVSIETAIGVRQLYMQRITSIEDAVVQMSLFDMGACKRP